MVDVRSKNLYELLGNDPELDPNREPEPPTRAVDRPIPRVGKRDAPKEAPSQPRLSENNARRGGRQAGNEAAFRDRNAGSRQNREKPIDEGKEPQRRAFHARGERGERVRNDRQSRTGVTDTRKQIDQGWGADSGEKTWDDERAGQDIAKDDQNEAQTPAGEEPQEPADKSKSYADYLAEQAAKEDLKAKPVRAPNEGSKADKKWANAKELKRDEEEEEYIKGSAEKAKREKQRKEKTFVDVDMRFVEQPRGGSSGPRGRGGRGGANGPRGGASAPRGRGGRGGRGNGPRGGERSAAGPTVTVDEKNFPSLGAK